MRTILTMAALGAAALALGACVPRVSYDGYEVSDARRGPLRQVTALDCPMTEGTLTRTGQAADGASCDYVSKRGETVRLSLVALDGRSAGEALEPMKAELRALAPVAWAPVPPVARDEPGEHANIDLPFFHVHTAGEHSDVRIFGVKVHADGDNAEVHTNLGLKHTVVHAGPRGAEVTAEDTAGPNASLVYVLASDRPAPSGYRVVGYIARGPASGPLVVGEFRSRDKRGDDHERIDGHGEPGEHHDDGDIGRLIDRNLHG
jgi:hypothetical protein